MVLERRLLNDRRLLTTGMLESGILFVRILMSIFRPNVVFLRAGHRSRGFRVVAHVPESKLAEFHHTNELEYWGEPGMTLEPDVSIRQIDFERGEAIVKFYAHWINERCVSTALESCHPPGSASQISLWDAFDFWHCESGGADLHDAIVDHMIVRMRQAVDSGLTPYRVVQKTFVDAQSFDTDTRILSEGRFMENLFSTLCLHHMERDLMARRDEAEVKILYLFNNAGTRALNYLFEAKTQRHFDDMPLDPLDENFDEHCRYHIHGLLSCYRLKSVP